MFFREEHDRGFARLVKLSELKNPATGFLWGANSGPLQITLRFSVEADANVFPTRYHVPGYLVLMFHWLIVIVVVLTMIPK